MKSILLVLVVLLVCGSGILYSAQMPQSGKLVGHHCVIGTSVENRQIEYTVLGEDEDKVKLNKMK